MKDIILVVFIGLLLMGGSYVIGIQIGATICADKRKDDEMSYKEEADILTDQLYAETEKVEALQTENKQLREKADAAAKKLNEYFIIYPRDRNKSDELVREAKEALKRDK